MNIIEFVEKICGVKVLDYQKELLFKIGELPKLDARRILLTRRCNPFTSGMYYVMSTIYGTRGGGEE